MNLDQVFESFKKCTVLVIGDVMIDSYIWGKVERISPEAPVPVVSVQKKENRLGGAANVLLNLQSLGAKPLLCSVVGNDSSGKLFMELLKDASLSAEGVIIDNERPTTVKTRVIGNHQQILRIDEELDNVVSSKINDQLKQKIESLISSGTIDVILFEDYDKGVLNEELISYAVALANQNGIKTVVDPKKRNFLKYKNVGLFKPNLKELKEGMKVDFNAKDQQQLTNNMQLLRKQLNAKYIMTTLSEDGVMIVDEHFEYHTPAHPRAIADVSGAGDTVISVAALGFSIGLSPDEFAELSNLAGGLVCEKVGVVPIQAQELKHEAAKFWK